MDAHGGYSLSWDDAVTVWADIIPVTGDEGLAHSRLTATLSLTVRIRYLEGITTDWRVLYHSRAFSIRAVINERERNESLTLLVEEITGA